MEHIMAEIHKGANWNRLNDAVTQTFWNQNTKQFWLDKDVPIVKDIQTWKTNMKEEEKETFVEALSGLTVLDTRQGMRGMPLISLHEKDEQRAAVLSFMGTMEHIHAKSYSKIFQTLIPTEKINYYLEEWTVNQPQLQYKADRIVQIYSKLWNPNAAKRDIFKAKVASVFLESFLFYSGFYYPLVLAGEGRMTDSADIINLIIRDESIHGAFVGYLAREDFQSFTPEEQEEEREWAHALLKDLYENELLYTKEVYSRLGEEVVEDVNKYVRYNANRAMLNLGFDPVFEPEKINPVVEAGLITETKTHDFFSRVSNSYFKANVTPVTDATFDMDRE
jgi:ribonucleoside-diphosphate reductase beta chain